MTDLAEGLEDLAPMPAPKGNEAPPKLIDPADIDLYQSALLAIHDLEVEIKTVKGFTIDHLVKKYKFETQEEFNKYFK
jgi:hypothetical protein